MIVPDRIEVMMRAEAAGIFLGDLSKREVEVFIRLANGQSIDDIAGAMAIHPSTVSTYKGRLIKKTGFDNEVEMAHFAIRHGLIAPMPKTRREPKR
jgi:two-component system invasion response regulator UvrY